MAPRAWVRTLERASLAAPEPSRPIFPGFGRGVPGSGGRGGGSRSPLRRLPPAPGSPSLLRGGPKERRLGADYFAPDSRPAPGPGPGPGRAGYRGPPRLRPQSSPIPVDQGEQQQHQGCFHEVLLNGHLFIRERRRNQGHSLRGHPHLSGRYCPLVQVRRQLLTTSRYRSFEAISSMMPSFKSKN